MANLKLAVRSLLKSPFVTGIAVLSLALGIGANAAIFSIFDQLLLRGLAVPNADRLVNLSAPGPKPGSISCDETGPCDDIFSYPMFRDLERDGAGFAAVAAHRLFGANVSIDGQSDRASGLLVSGRYFEALGLEPALGRLLGPGDDQQIGGHYVVVLSHDRWVEQLGSDPGVIGRTMVINGQPFTVVGVAPEGFRSTIVGNSPSFFVPLVMFGEVQGANFAGFDSRRTYREYLFALLREGDTMEQAAETANALYTSIITEVEVPLQTSMTAQEMERFRAKQLVVRPGHLGQSNMLEDMPVLLALLFTTTLFVLLIACANVANLLLARGAGRAQEMSIRAALGGSRSQLLRQLVLESLLLAGAAGALSLVVARWTKAIMFALAPPETPQMISFGIHPSMVVFTAAVAIGTGVVFGLYPALHATRTDLIAVLRLGGPQAADSRAAQRYRSGLVVAQFALSTALLFGAGLFVRSLVNIARVDAGFRTENLIAFDLQPAANGYAREQTLELFRRVEEELRALPGVTGVTMGRVPVLAQSSWSVPVSVEGFLWEPGVDAGSRFNAVGAGFFTTMEIPLLAGRDFSDADGEGAAQVAVVNEAFTRKFGLDGGAAIGARLSNDSVTALDRDIEIVGLVQDTRYNQITGSNPPILYLSYPQDANVGSGTFYVRTALDPREVMTAIPGLIAGLDPELPVDDLMTLDDQIRDTVFTQRFMGMLSAAFAVLATLLAAVGLYGVLSFTVSRRTREIGVRMALGAARENVRGLVLRQVTWMAAAGAVVGLAAAYWLARGAAAMLYDVSGYDPVSFAAAAVLLLAVALAAGYLPARRASSVDPMVALRAE
jgi:predicted permease